MSLKKASFYLFLLYVGVFALGILAQPLRQVLNLSSDVEYLMVNKVVLTVCLLGIVLLLNIRKECGLVAQANWRTLPLYWPMVLILAIMLSAGISPDTPSSTLMMLAITMLAVGINEELMFRGMVFYWFKSLSTRKVILISAVSFGAIHLIGLLSPIHPGVILAQAFFASGLGVIFAYARSRDFSIIIPILVHAVFNFITAGAKGGVSQTFTSANPEQIISGLLVMGAIAWLWGGYLLYKGDFRPRYEELRMV